MSNLIALIASALVAGAAFHALLVGPNANWARGSLFQAGLAVIALAATVFPMSGAGAIAAMLVPPAAANSLGNVASSVTGSLQSISKLVTAASYVAGLGFSIGAIFKFKQHKDNPTQAPGTRLASVAMALAGTLGTVVNSAAVQNALAGTVGAG